MQRTQIELEDDLHRVLQEVAEREGRSPADIIQEAVRVYLAAEDVETADDPFRPLIGAFAGGPTNAAIEHDLYLYGTSTTDPAQ